MAFMDSNSFGSDNEVKSVLQKFSKNPPQMQGEVQVHINFQNMSLNNSVAFFII